MKAVTASNAKSSLYGMIFICSSLIIFMFFSVVNAQSHKSNSDKIIFAYGGGPKKALIQYTAKLTGKENPRICYLPTASGDNSRGIIRWYDLCHDLNVQPSVLKVWISSYDTKQSFEEVLMSMDAIIVGGGNTLNMLAIWKAQGIDTVLNKAYNNGIILAGGSAGSLCWFLDGTTDSRPKELSTITGLGLLKYSHCPHYSSEASRRPLYQKKILSGEFIPGYAIDNTAGVVFKNGKYFESVSMNVNDHAYFVTVKDGKIVEKKLESKILKLN